MNTGEYHRLKQRTSYNLSNSNPAVGRNWRHFNIRLWSKWLNTSDGDAHWRTKACKFFDQAIKGFREIFWGGQSIVFS